MYLPKADIYNLLSQIDGVTVYQQRPEVDMELPAIVFSVPENNLIHELNGDLGYQDITITVDIFSTTSTQSSTLLATLYSTMQANSYMLAFASDVADPEGFSHITTQFKFIR